MGTFLKIAPQNRDVTFTSVDAGTAITAATGSFAIASGSFEGIFSGSFTGGANLTTPFFVTASKGYLSFLDDAVLTLVSTGSVSNIFLIQDSTGSAFAINGEGVTVLKTFTGSAPTPVQGGIYFSSYDMYIGTDDYIPSP